MKINFCHRKFRATHVIISLISYTALLSKIVPKAVVLLVLWGCSITDSDINTVKVSAQLVRVVSGQTIEVMIVERDNQPHRVRMIGINVPNSDNNLGQERAKTRLKELITENNLSLELEDNQPDRYNRILAHVWQNKMLVSEQLAKEGYVIANTKYPHKYSDRIFHAQEYARILGYGIWE